MNFKTTRQNDYWLQQKDIDHKYYIQNDILSDCIGIGSGSGITGDKNVSGFNYGKALGYALLAYFSSQSLGFARLPFFEDRIYAQFIDRDDEQLKQLFLKLDVQTVKEINTELRAIYDHTQEKLKHAGLKKVNLVRNIRFNNQDDKNYGFGFYRLIEAAKKLGHDHINLEMDILNSFTDNLGEYCHLNDVVIQHSVNAEDILYCSNLVGRDGVSELVEHNEWVVINRSPTGVVKLPINSFKINDSHVISATPITDEQASDFMNRHSPFVFRGVNYFPPQYGTYGKKYSWKKRLAYWLIRDNPVAS